MSDTVLNSSERSEYKRLCKVIDEKLNSFVEVGQALQRIKEGKLYRAEEFKTFEAFCKEKFKIERAHAYRMIEAAKVVSNVEEKMSPKGDKIDVTPIVHETQARELAKAPEEKQAEAWTAAVEKADGKQPTQKQVKDAVAEVIAETEQQKDRYDRIIPDHLLPIANCDYYAGLLRLADQVYKAVRQAADHPSCVRLVNDLRLFEASGKQFYRFNHAEDIRRDITMNAFHCVCPLCEGKKGGCHKCDKHGWLTALGYKCVSEEDKK